MDEKMIILKEIKGIVTENGRGIADNLLRIMSVEDSLVEINKSYEESTAEYYKFVEENNKKMDMLFAEMAENRKDMQKLLHKMDDNSRVDRFKVGVV